MTGQALTVARLLAISMLSPLLVREQCQPRSFTGPVASVGGWWLHAVDIQLVIEYLDVEHRAEQGFIPAARRRAHDSAAS